jgi:hypothetical protein
MRYRVPMRSIQVILPAIFMWRLASSFSSGCSTAMFTNAVAVYAVHDVDADRIGQWNLASWELTNEFVIFSLGTLVFGQREVKLNTKLGSVLGIAVILVQYAMEFTVRKLNGGRSADAFLLGYLLLSPFCCPAIILLNSPKPRAETASNKDLAERITTS